jgi:hypothetical protein
MKDLVIELVLVAMIIVPVIADSLQPAKAIPNNRLGTPRKLHPGA